MILNILKKKNTQSDDVVEYSKAREALEKKNFKNKMKLARKITRLFPQITPDEKNTICEKAIEMLEILANDQLPSVRQLLAEELKSN